ncbi:MAG: hypothetical protein WCH04_19020 [Gammaproteobacteria bacterium]
MKTALATFFVLLSGVLAAPSALALPITVTSNDVVERAYDEATGNSYSTYSGTVVPATVTLPDTTGKSSSTTTLNYSGSTTSATFSTSMAHSIDNTGGPGGVDFADFAQTSDFDPLRFTAAVNSTYSISGFYDMLGPAGTRTYLSVDLYDITASSFLFRD